MIWEAPGQCGIRASAQRGGAYGMNMIERVSKKGIHISMDTPEPNLLSKSINTVHRYHTTKYICLQIWLYSSFWNTRLRIYNIDDVNVIDLICTCTKLIFQLESNKYRTKTGNQKYIVEGSESLCDTIQIIVNQFTCTEQEFLKHVKFRHKGKGTLCHNLGVLTRSNSSLQWEKQYARKLISNKEHHQNNSLTKQASVLSKNSLRRYNFR